MPGGDRTGPLGYGPMTGRRLGYCSGYQEPGYWHPSPGLGYGRGRGFGPGRGFGRGLGLGLGRGRGRVGFGRYWGYSYPPMMPSGYLYGTPYRYPTSQSYGYPYGRDFASHESTSGRSLQRQKKTKGESK